MLDTQTTLEYQLLANTKAATRFYTGGDRPRHLIAREQQHLANPRAAISPFDDEVTECDVYLALSSALRAGRVVDLRVSSEVGSSEWWKGAEDGGLVPGFRYARNAVEHDGIDPISYPAGTDDLPPRMRAARTRWRAIEARRQSGRSSFAKHLEGENIAASLMKFNWVLTQGAGMALGFDQAA
jgi:hypothetical protein